MMLYHYVRGKPSSIFGIALSTRLTYVRRTTLHMHSCMLYVLSYISADVSWFCERRACISLSYIRRMENRHAHVGVPDVDG